MRDLIMMICLYLVLICAGIYCAASLFFDFSQDDTDWTDCSIEESDEWQERLVSPMHEEHLAESARRRVYQQSAVHEHFDRFGASCN